MNFLIALTLYIAGFFTLAYVAEKFYQPVRHGAVKNTRSSKFWKWMLEFK